MQYHDGRADALGEIERVEGVLDGQLAVALAGGGKFVEVRRCAGDADGQRTKVVQAGNFDLAGLHGVEDAGHQAETDAVAQLGVFKAQIADLAQHRAAVGVAGGIPAG